MSKIAESLLQEFQKLPPVEREGLLQQFLRLSVSGFAPASNQDIFPTVKLGSGRITSEQVMAALDDE